MKLCLYNNRVAPDLNYNSSGKLKGRGTKQAPVLRNYTNLSQGSFITSLRSGPCSFISPPMPRKTKKSTWDEENIYTSFSNDLGSTKIRKLKQKTNRPSTSHWQRNVSESFDSSLKLREPVTKIRKMSIYIEKSSIKKYQSYL